MIEVVVDNRIRVRAGELPAELIERLRQEFTHANPARAKLERLGVRGYALHREPKLIASWKLEGDELTLPRGGMGRLREALEDFGVGRRVVDARVEGTGPRGIPAHRVALRDFQERIVEEAMRVENCVVRAPTGCGKTTAALALASRIDLPTLVVVWTGGLLDQWVRRAESELGLAGDEVGIIGGGSFRIRPLTIAMQQSLAKHAARVRGLFGVVIADELQRFAAKTFFDAIDTMPARYRIGVSADERRKDRKEFLIYDVFGDIAVDVSQAELVERGFIHDVEVRVVPTAFDAPWYRSLMDRSHDPPDGPSKATLQARLLAFDRISDEMTTDAARGDLATAIAEEEVGAGEQVVLMSHRREQCRRLDADLSARGIRCGLMLGGEGVDATTYARTLEDVMAGRLRAAAGTYQAIGQGIDLPSVGVGVCCSPIANSRDGRSFFSQVRGRLCRRSDDTGKTGARLYYLLDELVYGVEPVRNLCRWNRRVLVRDGAAWIDGREWLRRKAAEG